MQNKTFVLTFVNAGKVSVIIQGDVKLCQKRKKELKNGRIMKGGYFQIRTLEGYLAVPILEPKKKT